ncbi:MAG TPA: hypothetical protein VFW78_05575 [Bacteroidia bacterium]|nr:hypothetical protein [Bacteroidia bacterium]
MNQHSQSIKKFGIIKISLLLPFLFFFHQVSFAQSESKPIDVFHDAEGNTWHKMYLDTKASEIISIEYLNSSDPVDGILDPSGDAILIKNYPGDKAVKVIYREYTGNEHETSKGKCFIDPVLLAL